MRDSAKALAKETKMKRQTLISGLIAGAALTLLGGCAYDDDYYGRGYSSGSVYYGTSTYDPYYYGSDYQERYGGYNKVCAHGYSGYGCE